MCCQILQLEGHYAMNGKISLLPDDKCYLLSEGLVNLTRVWHSPFLYQTFEQRKILITLYGFVLLGFSLHVSCIHRPTLKYHKRWVNSIWVFESLKNQSESSYICTYCWYLKGGWLFQTWCLFLFWETSGCSSQNFNTVFVIYMYKKQYT